MKYGDTKTLSESDFRRMTGIGRDTFSHMVNILRTEDAVKKRRGGRKSKLSIEDMLLMTLEYHREYRILLPLFGGKETAHREGSSHHRFGHRKSIVYGVRTRVRPRFSVVRESGIHIGESTVLYADSDYTGIHGLHPYSILPERKPREGKLSSGAKKHNRLLSAVRVGVENAIGFLKRFRILKGVFGTGGKVRPTFQPKLPVYVTLNFRSFERGLLYCVISKVWKSEGSGYTI